MLTIAAVVWCAGAAGAQSDPGQTGPDAPSSLAAQAAMLVAQEAATPPAWVAERRACEACPPRSVGKALLQTTIVNGFYEAANLIRGQVTARITPKSWWANMQQGWVWDLDDFVVNQIGHPYQGSNYFNTGRANGLSFYESAAVTAFGSATWEYYGETNYPSLNDLINTTLGGVALGEMFHRTAWLVRNPGGSGRGRKWNEIAAAVIDPITGANRFLTGDASTISGKPPEMVPSDLTAFASAGVLWRGSESRVASASGQPFLEVSGIYGDPEKGRSRTPYEAFSVRLRFGGGSGFSEANVRGRLLGQPFRDDRFQFMVLQSYDFQSNDAYHSGAQSIEAAFGATKTLSPSARVWILAWAGLAPLGAVDALPLDLDEAPEEEAAPPSGGQGVSEGPRYYDYGPGSNVGVTATFFRQSRPFALVSYEGRHLYSLDGVRANHFLQRGRVELRAPLRGALGLGGALEYFDRRTFYQDEARTVKRYHYPQVRAFFSWSVS